MLILLMFALAMVAFVPLLWLVRRGSNGVAISLLSLMGASLVVLDYATRRPFGIDPFDAGVLMMIFVLPAFLGGAAGAVLGLLLRKSDDRRISNPPRKD